MKKQGFKRSWFAFITSLVVLLSSFGVASATSTFLPQQGGTGTTSPSGILYGTNSGTNPLQTVSIGTGLSFIAGVLTNTGVSAFGYPFPYFNNTGTTTPILLFASTTIGNGNGASGLTVFGNSTTTGSGYFASNVGIGTTSPYAPLSVAGLGVFDNLFATSTTATSTFKTPILLDSAPTNLANFLSFKASRVYPASVSTGGAWLCDNGTLNTGPCLVIHSNAGQTTGRLLVINDENTSSSQDTIIASSSSATITTFNIKGEPTGKGILKIEATGGAATGFSNASAISLDTSLNDTQGIFIKSGTGIPLNIQNASSQTLFKIDGLGNSTTTRLSEIDSLTANQVVYTNPSKILTTTGTSTPSVTAPITYSGTLGFLIGGVSGSFGCTSASAGVTGCLTGSDWSLFNNKISSTSLSGASVISYTAASGIITTTPGTFAGATPYTFPQDLVITGNSTSTIGTFTTKASTTALVIGGITGTQCLHTTGNGVVAGTGSDCGSSSTFTYPFSYFNNTGTSTPVLLFASTTIGNGNGASGLTIFGNATTTGTSYHIGNVGIGTTSPYAPLSVVGAGGVVADHYIATSTTNQSYIVGGLTVGDATLSRNTYQLVSIGTNNTTGIGDLGIMGDANLGTTDGNTIGFQHSQANSTNGALQTTAGWDFIGDSHTSGAQSTSIAFATRNAGSYGERLRLNFNGKIGVASSTPYAFFSVNPTAAATLGGAEFVVGSSTATHLVVLNNGNAGVGTTSPWRKWSVAGTQAYTGLTSSSGGNAICINATTNDVENAGTQNCTISSIRFKQNVQPLSGNTALSILKDIDGYSYDYKTGYYSPEDSPKGYGPVAEYVAKTHPELVDYKYDGTPGDIFWNKLTGLNTDAINQLQVEIDNIQTGVRSVEENWQWGVMAFLFLWCLYLTFRKEKWTPIWK